MKIIAPISKVEEAGVFARVGAEELFVGVVPDEWRQRYGRFTPNRRSENNLNSLAGVREVVSAVHGEGKRVSVAVNGATHTAEQVAYMSELATELAALDVDAFIVGDIQLLSVIHNLKLPTRLHVSSIAACRNLATAHLYYKLGANRVILPRHMSLREIGKLVRAVPELEFEVFVLEEIIAFAQQIRGEPDLCRDGCMCYYPEIVVADTIHGTVDNPHRESSNR